MGKQVVYEGPRSRDDLSTEFHVRDDDGKMHVLYADQPSDELPDSLAKELLDGDSERVKGHKFRAPSKDEAQEPAPDPSPDAGGGPGGSGPRPGGGTTAAGAAT